jgi:lycopene cyclase domain-containing protein
MGYLTILALLLMVSLYLENKYEIHLFSSKKERFTIIIIFFIIGTIWDSYAVASGHWYFDYNNLTGIKIGLLPLEEYFFFLILPYFLLTVYRVLKIKI